MNSIVRHRKTYDTRVKYLIRKDQLPDHYRKQIHRSLISKWKREPDEKYVGYELNHDAAELYEMMKLFSENKTMKRALYSFYRINKVLRDTIEKSGSYLKILKKNKDEIVKTIQRVKGAITLEKAVKLLGIGTSTYRIWSMEEFFKCNHSLSKLCSNSFPQQLTVKEIGKMHRLLHNAKFLHWPIVSLAYYGQRKSILNVHRNTWYKYVRLMRIERFKNKKSTRNYAEGIRATGPNQKWHADVTELHLGNGTIGYIYLVVDNFTRYIISWKVAGKICAASRLETFKEAIHIAKDIRNKKCRLDLIVDGGTENNNKIVENFLHSQRPRLRKLIALKDIKKSNSLVESLNRVLKYNYLFPKNIYDLTALENTMQWAVTDYNTKRPHGALNGQTPLEAYFGKKRNIRSLEIKMENATRQRILFNQTHSCKGCPFGC